MNPSRRQKAISRDSAFYIAKEHKKTNLRPEFALLHATAELRFHGRVIIKSREDTIPTLLPPASLSLLTGRNN